MLNAISGLRQPEIETSTKSQRNEKGAPVGSLLDLLSYDNVRLFVAKANLHKPLIALTLDKNQDA